MSDLTADEAARTSLELVGVTKQFGGRTVVDVESLELGANAVEGLIGPNGAGKTTLMRLIMQSLAADGGEIVLRSGGSGRQPTSLSRLAPHEVARLGVVKTNQVTQDFRNLTIWDSLLLAVAGPADERPTRLLGERRLMAEHGERIRAHLDRFSFEDPFGFAHSAGEKKLLDLLRCLLLEPRILLLDEPTAGLPEDVTHEVMALVRERADAGMSIVIVEHDLDVIWGYCDIVHFMAEGKVVLQGSPDEVRSHRTVVEQYLGGSHV